MAAILVAEDDKAIAEAVASYLESRGHDPIVTHDGKSALVQFAGEDVDLVVLDLGLPGASGETVCRKIRASKGAKANTAVIMVTAKAEEEDIIKGLDLGADDYITKPFSLRELVARVDAVLRRRDALIEGRVTDSRAETAYNDGTLQVNFTKKTVAIAGTETLLTPTEFRILETLMRDPGRVYTREDLIASALGGTDFAGFDRTVDSHIKNLRRKLKTRGVKDGKKADSAYVVTIHGLGYKFAPPGGR